MHLDHAMIVPQRPQLLVVVTNRIECPQCIASAIRQADGSPKAAPFVCVCFATLRVLGKLNSSASKSATPLHMSQDGRSTIELKRGQQFASHCRHPTLADSTITSDNLAGQLLQLH
eukprot:4491403-Amphidinium_carterae.2